MQKFKNRAGDKADDERNQCQINGKTDKISA
jgi:hypothetical protein